MKISIIIAYHSGYGHTEKVAKAVASGAEALNNTAVSLLNITNITEKDWEELDKADAIIFGCPTYMGGVSAKFKEFIDQTSKRWYNQSWKNKIAAGFTNSSTYSGDKLNTLFQLAVNAMQHGMIWVGLGLLPASAKGVEGPDSNQINRIGSYIGLATQANGGEPPEVAPPHGDLETAKLFGKRVAEVTQQFAKGKA
ncbi:MAG: NADPH-dependent reductase [Rickettsiaceae bacterium]|jgi:NAD(P)H dehydrogenase (quinone)|nr:NADPH-dependent reductase [Rickettsiaceae bacterium]